MNETRKALMNELRNIQDTMDHQDILTITAFLDDDQLAAHVDRYRRLTGLCAMWTAPWTKRADGNCDEGK